MSPLEQVMRKLRLAVGVGIANLIDDARKIQQLQISALDEEVRDTVNRMQDYGFTSCPEDGAEVLFAAVGGNRNHLIAVRVDDGRYRKKNLAPGEVAMYHKSGSYVLLKANGDVEVFSATKLAVQAPLVTMSGNLTVTGTIDGGTVKQGGIVLGSHAHSGIQPGGSNTGGPV